MEKVVANPTLQSSLPNYFISKRLAMATQELVVGLCVYVKNKTIKLKC